MLIRKAVRRIVPGQWWSSIETNSIQNIRPVRGSKYTKTAVQTREKLTEHLVAGGSVSWQWDYIRRTGNEEDKYFLTMALLVILLSTLCQNKILQQSTSSYFVGRMCYYKQQNSHIMTYLLTPRTPRY